MYNKKYFLLPEPWTSADSNAGAFHALNLAMVETVSLKNNIFIHHTLTF